MWSNLKNDTNIPTVLNVLMYCSMKQKTYQLVHLKTNDFLTKKTDKKYITQLKMVSLNVHKCPLKFFYESYCSIHM